MRRFEAFAEAAPVPAPIGHNGGPPLDLSFKAWAWRRAHARAWKTPGREIVLLRMRRAARLGLGYRDYTGVLLDRGVHLGGVVILRDDAFPFAEEIVARKRATLFDCAVMDCRVGKSEAIDETADRIVAFVRSCQAAPSAFFLVGEGARARTICARAKLALFVEARCYFEVMR